MSSTKTKENLIEIISSSLMERSAEKKIETKLMITSTDAFPEETKMGVRIKQRDLKILFDKADYIIPQQADCAVKEAHGLIRVICPDTDIFVLLSAMYIVKNWSNSDVDIEDFIGEKF